MSERRWFNNRLPQTLVISQFLLYFNAFWGLLGALGGGLGLLGIVYIAVNVYGAYGIANELKRGYQVAVVASFLPIVLPALILALSGDLFGRLLDVLVPGGIINAIFVYALIALLLHPQSRDHQKIWFA